MSLEQLALLARELPPTDQLRLIQIISGQMLEAVTHPQTQAAPLYGVLAHLGQAPSAEEIDAVRQEMWAKFPREDL